MSVHVLSWVLRESEAKLGDRLVLLVLADHAKEDGTSAWPSVDTISVQSRLTRRQVQRCLRNLEEAGRIKQTGKSRAGTSIYTVLGYPHRGDNMTPPGGTSTTSGGDRITPDPSLEQPSVEPIAAAPRNGHPPRRTKAELNEVWDTLSEIWGEPSTRSEVTQRGKLVQSLGAAGATRDEIFKRAKTWPQHFDSATLTAEALEKHWTALGRKPLRRR